MGEEKLKQSKKIGCSIFEGKDKKKRVECAEESVQNVFFF